MRKTRIVALVLCAFVLIPATFFTNEGVVLASADAVPKYLFRVERRVAWGGGSAALVRRNPDCLLASAHTVGFAGEIVKVYMPSGTMFFGKVIKRARAGPLTHPGDKTGLAIIMLLDTAREHFDVIKIPPVYTYHSGEALEIPAFLGPRRGFFRTFAELFSLRTETVELVEPRLDPDYVDTLELLLAVETGGDKARRGYSGSPVLNSKGQLVGVLQGPVLVPRENKEVLETIGFTPHWLIKQFFADTACNPFR